jgi:hypothetical protein
MPLTAMALDEVGIHEYLDFIHHPVFQKNTTFQKLHLLPTLERMVDTSSAGSVRES